MITDCVPLHIGKHMNDDEALVSLNVYGRDGIPVCRMGGNVSATEPTLMSKHEAFAQLFAAAPDLLAALSALVSQAIDSCGVMSGFAAMPVRSLSDKFPATIARLNSRIDEARKAIAKAEGR